ncbi:unknown protein [Microcystis aeruginosa NIES-843]|uniref:Uncharacterized protein n=1 Tax=Microcystis aeruginosa (strain NIES-843 / IAM M-2473) TaxID=449447 RepID=B0JMR2_MICAN|nr:unknown protein [Microcystis aeruginosa NIES-843]
MRLTPKLWIVSPRLLLSRYPRTPLNFPILFKQDLVGHILLILLPLSTLAK